MSYTKKLLKITWFGIENNYTMIGIILLISCFLMPAFTVLTLMMNNGSGYIDESSAQSVIKVYGTVLAYLEGFILPIGLFSYVHKRRSCDFYNSMPVGRSQYFFGYALTGLAVFTVSFCWMFVVHFVLLGFSNIFPCFLPPFALFITIYCSMIFAVCFSGSIMSALVTFVLRNCIYVSIVLLPLVIAGVDMNSYFDFFFEKPLCVLTPVTAVGCWAADWYGIMLLQVLVALVELAMAFLLHRYRKSETTMAIAFPKSRYPFQYIVTLMAAFLVDALVMYSIDFMNIRDDTDYNFFKSNDFYLLILITLIVIIISFAFLNIILEKNGRAAFSKIRHLFIFTACYALVMFTIFNWIAPNIPYQVLPFNPEYAVICVNDVIVTKEDDPYFNPKECLPDEIYDYDYCEEIPDSAISHGDYYSLSISETVSEAYCITDRDKLNKLLKTIQRSRDFITSEYSRPIPNVYSEEELRSIKMYTIYFMKGNKPYIQEGMSIYNFSSLNDYDRCLKFYCSSVDGDTMDDFKDIRLDPMDFSAGGNKTVNVYIPDPEYALPDQDPEVTWSGGMPAMPENPPVTSEGWGFDNPPIASETAFVEIPPVTSQTAPPVMP
ncbi:MAG: hypothetical protein K2K41_07255 [Ruminiclostridium sp.]|nr:hypothetical protein [Ruminiclostridium sp.]